MDIEDYDNEEKKQQEEKLRKEEEEVRQFTHTVGYQCILIHFLMVSDGRKASAYDRSGKSGVSGSTSAATNDMQL